MKKQKMSLGNIKDVLNRDEMKQIMAGSGGCTAYCKSSSGGNLGSVSVSSCQLPASDLIKKCKAEFPATTGATCVCG